MENKTGWVKSPGSEVGSCNQEYKDAELIYNA